MDYKSALNKSAAICSKQECCCADIHKKLNNWGLDPEESQKIVQYLLQEKFIDESRYAHFFVREKFKFNRWGKIKIRWHLAQKKIPRTIIDDALTQISSKEYQETLEKLIDEKLKQLKSQEPMKRKASVIRNAASKGFEYETIVPIVERRLNT